MNTYIISLCLFFSAFIAFKGCQQSSESSLVYFREAKSQISEKRNVVGDIPNMDQETFRHALRDSAIIDTLVFNVLTGIKTNPSYIFIKDQGDFSVKQYSKLDGRLIHKYSNGRGTGPGEIVDPLSFQVAENGSVWIIDNGNRRISIFDDNSGDFIQSFDVNIPFTKAAISPSLDKVVLLRMRDSVLFHIHSVNMDALALSPYTSTGKWVKDQGNKHVNLHGELRTHPSKDVFYYLSSHDGWLYGGSFDGKEQFLRKTIDNLDLAGKTKRDETKEGYYLDTHNAVMHVLMSVSDEKLYVWRADVETFTGFLDIYNAEDGDYIESFKSNIIPECRMQGVFEDHVYFTCNTFDYSYVSRYPLEVLRYENKSDS